MRAAPGIVRRRQLTGTGILIAARGYGEGGVFRELQDPPWLLPAVPWYCKGEEMEHCFKDFREGYKV